MLHIGLGLGMWHPVDDFDDPEEQLAELTTLDQSRKHVIDELPPLMKAGHCICSRNTCLKLISIVKTSRLDRYPGCHQANHISLVKTRVGSFL